MHKLSTIKIFDQVEMILAGTVVQSEKCEGEDIEISSANQKSLPHFVRLALNQVLPSGVEGFWAQNRAQIPNTVGPKSLGNILVPKVG